MDTKSLYDWASEAGLKFDGEYDDAVTVWQKALYNDESFLEDNLLDAIAEVLFPPMPSEDREDTMIAQRTRFFARLGSGINDVTHLTGRFNDRMNACYATSLAFNATQTGEELILTLKAWIDAYVEKYADEWWNECIGYHNDMEEGQREDYEYERWKDRQLEERESRPLPAGHPPNGL